MTNLLLVTKALCRPPMVIVPRPRVVGQWYSMDTEQIVQRIFKIDKSIRYVALVDSEYHLLESKMREGIATLTSEEVDRNFYSIAPPIVLDAVAKLEPYYGSFRILSIRYEKVVAVYCRSPDYIIAFTLNPEVETPFLDKIANAIREIFIQ